MKITIITFKISIYSFHNLVLYFHLLQAIKFSTYPFCIYLNILSKLIYSVCRLHIIHTESHPLVSHRNPPKKPALFPMRKNTAVIFR